MKKSVLQFTGIFIILLLSTSCFHEKIEGNGRVTIESRSVGTFDEVYIDGVFNVFISQGDDYIVEIETDRNLQDIVNVSSKRSKLYIDLDDYKNFDATKMNIYITAPDFSKFDFDGVGNIISETVIASNFLEILSSGVGNLDMEVEVENLDVRHDGVGSVYLFGSAIDFTIINDGVGKVHAFELMANNVNITNSGVGDAEVYANEILEVLINGIGDVSYKGYPAVIYSSINGVGKLKNRN